MDVSDRPDGAGLRVGSEPTTEPEPPRTQPSPLPFRRELLEMARYQQGRQAPGSFKLSSNENPYPPLPSVQAAIERAGEEINRYPDGSAHELVTRLAALADVPEDWIVTGPGSIAVLQQVLATVVTRGDEVVFAWPSFEGYHTVCAVLGATPVAVPLARGGVHDLDAMLDAIGERTRAVLLCTPNNPTGQALRADDVERFVAAVPEHVLIVLDEAYHEFVRDPDAVDGLPVVREHPNTVTLRTLSKAFGLAGLRAGYGVASPALVDLARVAELPFALGSITIAAAAASLDAREEIAERVDDLVARRGRLVAGLVAQGWDVGDPQGNFVWLPTGERTADIAPALAEHDVTARVFPPLGVRITVGEEDSVPAVLDATQQIADALHLSEPRGDR